MKAFILFALLGSGASFASEMAEMAPCNGTCWKMVDSGDTACAKKQGKDIACDVGTGPAWTQVGDKLFDCVPTRQKKGSFGGCIIGGAKCYVSYFGCSQADDEGKTHYVHEDTLVFERPTDRGVGSCTF